LWPKKTADFIKHKVICFALLVGDLQEFPQRLVFKDGEILFAFSRSRSRFRAIYSSIVRPPTATNSLRMIPLAGCRHYPTTKHTVVADTPENRRIAKNTKVQSNVSQHVGMPLTLVHYVCSPLTIVSKRR